MFSFYELRKCSLSFQKHRQPGVQLYAVLICLHKFRTAAIQCGEQLLNHHHPLIKRRLHCHPALFFVQCAPPFHASVQNSGHIIIHAVLFIQLIIACKCFCDRLFLQILPHHTAARKLLLLIAFKQAGQILPPARSHKRFLPFL